MKIFTFDVMIGERYVCTLNYRYNPAFILTEEEITDFVIANRPSLKGKDFRIAF